LNLLLHFTFETATACLQKNQALNEQEQKFVTETLANMKTHCVGRYLIDLPDDVAARGWIKLNGITVEAKPMPFEQFTRDMDELESKLKTTKSSLGYRYLYEHGSVGGMSKTKYFVSLGDPGASSDLNRLIEAYKWDDGYQFQLSIEATDSINSVFERKYKDTPYGSDWNVNDLPEKLRLVSDLVGRLRGLRDGIVPTEPGTCFVGGFLQSKAESDAEEVHSYFVLGDKPDVSLSLESFGNLVPETTLLRRVSHDETRNALKAAKGKVIRSGTVELPGGLKVDEFLVAAMTSESPPIAGHQFSLEANYASGPRTPYLLFDMNTGSPTFLAGSDSVKHASLTEGEAVALWDAISRTLRARPNAF
jgi:hypothetical protein